MGNETRIMRNGVILLVLLSCLPCVAAEAPPCIAYAYTVAQDEPHYSLIQNGAFVFGSEVIVVSNCNNTTLLIDGNFQSSSDRLNLMSYVSSGVHNVTIMNDGFSTTMTNVTFIQSGQLSMVVSQLPNQHNPHAEPWTPEEISNLELVSGIGSLLISWFMVVGILWKLINNHTDRNFCREVA